MMVNINSHFIYYKNLTTKLFKIFPSKSLEYLFEMLKNFLCFLSFFSANGFEIECKVSDSGSHLALTHVIRELYDHQNVTHIDSIIIGRSHLNEEFIQTILKFHYGTYRTIRRDKNTQNRIDNPAVVFVDSVEQLYFFIRNSFFTNQKLKYVLFFVRDIKKKLDVTKILIHSPPNCIDGLIIHFSYFMIEEKNQILLKTFEWWTPMECGVAQFVTLNTFNLSQLKWTQNPLKITEKFTNFHNCTIKHHSTFFASPTIELLVQMGEQAVMLDPGIPALLEKQESVEVKLRNLFAQKGNFTSLGGLQKKYGATICQYINWGGETECSMASFQNPYVAMYSPSDPYSNYEKMLMPFENMIWFGLCTTFFLSFVSIYFINQSKFKKLIYGQREQSPFMNVVNILFGNAQKHLPSENFGRIILISFVFFCLVVRTTYQGVFFEKFTSGLKRSPPETYADLKERDYTIYTPKDYFDYLNFAVSRSTAYMSM